MRMPQQLQNNLLSYVLPKILPPDYRLKISSWDDIRNLGKGNIETLVWAISNPLHHSYGDEEQPLRQLLFNSLRQLAETSEARPLLPQFRDSDYISEGDSAVVFYPEKNLDRGVMKETFIEGKVTYVLYGLPWTVYFLPDKGYITADYKEGTELFFHVDTPEIITKSDFNILINNPGFAYLWLNNLKESDVPKGYKEKLLELVIKKF